MNRSEALRRLATLVVLAATAAAPLPAQSLAGARAGLSSPVQMQSSAVRTAMTDRPGSSSLLSGSDDTGDKLVRGMVTGAAVGLVIGYLVNMSQSNTAGAKSVLLPAVGIGALLGLMLGSG